MEPKRKRGAQVNHVVSEETRKKIGNANRGRKMPESARKHWSRVRTGKKQSSETVNKRIQHFIGVPHSEDRKLKISGEGAGASKLLNEQVISIRSEYATGLISQRALARKYNVAQSTIGAIVRGETWDHI